MKPISNYELCEYACKMNAPIISVSIPFNCVELSICNFGAFVGYNCGNINTHTRTRTRTRFASVANKHGWNAYQFQDRNGHNVIIAFGYDNLTGSTVDYTIVDRYDVKIQHCITSHIGIVEKNETLQSIIYDLVDEICK